MEPSYSPSGENDEGGWHQRFWRSVSPSRDQSKARSADGQDKEEMFRERATYTAHGEDNHGKAQAGNKHAKATGEVKVPVTGGISVLFHEGYTTYSEVS